MRRPRMTTRRWMIVVVLAAVLLGVDHEFRLASLYRRKAGYHGALEIIYSGRKQRRLGADGKSLQPMSPASAALAAYHAALRQKYERAADRPWVRVPLDPDPPPL